MSKSQANVKIKKMSTKKKSLKQNNKAQVFTWDIVFATIIFLVALTMIIHIWDSTIAEMDAAERTYDMEWLSNTASEQLVRTHGDPKNWTYDSENVIIVGLADVRPYGPTKVMDRIIDPDKLLHFVNITENNYAAIRSRLLGSGKYEFYTEISCLNNTKRDCFEGLYVDTIENGSVVCLNGFNFTVVDHSIYSDVYIWREAENYDIANSITLETPAASMSNDSNVELNNANDWLSYNISIPRDGTYQLFTRYDRGPAAPLTKVNFSMDGVAIADIELGGSGGTPAWKNITSVTLTQGMHILKLNRTESASSSIDLDIILLTTDMGCTPPDIIPTCTAPPNRYDCILSNETTKCIIGNYVENLENVTYMVSATKTATFAGNSTRIMRLKFVVLS